MNQDALLLVIVCVAAVFGSAGWLGGYFHGRRSVLAPLRRAASRNVAKAEWDRRMREN